MASDVLQDLIRALCSLSIVEPPVAKRGATTPAPSTVRSSPQPERHAASAQEAA